MPHFKQPLDDSLDFDKVMVPGSSANGNNQIDIHQNLHPFNHNVIAQEKNKLTKSNYVSSDQYKPFEGLSNTVDKIQYP